MEELTSIQTALKAWFWIGHSREPTKICSNSNTSRLQAGPRPQLSKQPQTCSAPCSSPACPEGGNACGIPAESGGSRSRDRSREGIGAAPPSPRNAGIPCRYSPALSGQATAAGSWAPWGWVSLGNACLGHTSHITALTSSPTGFRCLIPLLPLLAAFPWTCLAKPRSVFTALGKPGHSRLFYFCFFHLKLCFQRQLLCELVFVFKTFRG